MIPYARQQVTRADIDAVTEILQSDFLTQGPAVSHFEQAVASRVQAQYAVSANSATSALHIACLALGLKPGGWLWTSPITFVASANCALYCGAQVDFVDIDPTMYTLCPEALARKLEQAKRSGQLPDIVVPVHLCGQPCDMEAIYALSQKYGFKIIEDASHAIGGTYRGEPVGNGRYSDITVFSFHPVKIITTGEGGMALTNDVRLAEQMMRLRSHGITRDPGQMTKEPDGSWYYEQIELGFNYRMTDIQAALGASQLLRLDEFVTRRHALAKRYNDLLAGMPVVTPWQHPHSYSAFHLYVIRLKLEEIKSSHRQIFESLRESGVQVNLHYIPVYAHPYYRRMGFNPADFPNAEAYYAEVISLPMYPALSDQQQDQVAAALRKAIGL